MKRINSAEKASTLPPPPPLNSGQSVSTSSAVEFDGNEYCNFETSSGKFKASAEEPGFDHNADEWDEYEEECPSSVSSPSLASTLGSDHNSQTLSPKKSGPDAFLFTAAEPVPIGEKIVAIVDSPDGLIWKPANSSYTCTVADPKKESKLGGMKSFVTYQLVPSFSNIQVGRRYKQFAWLCDRLNEKFSTISIPPLPQRPYTAGKFDQEFVNGRLRVLQLWVMRMCRHPVVSHADVFLHFLTCTDEKKWSKGKRMAEKDECVQYLWFRTIQAPTLNSAQADMKIDQFSQFVKNMDAGLCQMVTTGELNMKRHEAFKKEYQRLGSSFVTLAKSFDLDKRQTSVELSKALEQTGKAYEDIGQMFGSQPSIDMLHLMEGLQEYRGMLTTLPSSIAIHKESARNVTEKISKSTDPKAQTLQKRVDAVTATVLANMLYFQQERVVDFKVYMSEYLQKQIEFHTMITTQLRSALEYYEKIGSP